MSSPSVAEACPINTAAPAPAEVAKPKPCCVCKNEKGARDECLLFYGQESGKCDDFITQYKGCMKGFGFQI